MRSSMLLAVWTSMAGGVMLQAAPLPESTGDRGGHSPRSAQTAGTTPWITRQTTFSIPFTVEKNGPAPANVELYVSRNRGESWQLHATQQPATKHFQFRSTTPGEYWFASRTTSTDRTAVDPQQLQPELRVIIDLEEPKLTFEAKVGPAGEIEASWQAADETLDPATLSIEYRTHINDRWRPVAVDRQRARFVDGQLVGTTVWWPESRSPAIHVRAEIKDRAGNKSVVNRVALLPKTGSSTNSATAGIPEDPFRQARKLAQHSITWPTTNRLPNPEPTNPRRPTDSQEYFVQRDMRSATQNPVAPELPSQQGRYPRMAPAAQEVARPPVATKFTSAPTPPAAESQPVAVAPQLPPGQRARMTRSREFRLDYRVEAEGPSGVRKIELWGTSDAGATWSLWKLDEDRQSPVDVTVDQEGIYGFRVVVVANNGLAGTVPRNGDPADLWVGVDDSLPEAQLTSASYGDQDHFGQLDIRWDARDAWLTEEPVTLLYSDQPGGPWTTVRSGLPNTGQYYWPIEPRIPDRIYLKIEVRDQAGNLGTHQLADPIQLSGLFPKATIQGLRTE